MLYNILFVNDIHGRILGEFFRFTKLNKKKMSRNEDVNCYIGWLENSTDNGRFIYYYDYKEFKNEQSIGKGLFESVVSCHLEKYWCHFALKWMKSFNTDRIKGAVNEIMYSRKLLKLFFILHKPYWILTIYAVLIIVIMKIFHQFMELHMKQLPEIYMLEAKSRKF